ncbi:MAG: carbohydrate kinase [Bacteroides sp. SM23_62]|nr:MAG: carbohydrate kinase [Bacteroides sp. SM23_62]
MILLGYDIGSSSVKASIIDAETASVIASAFQPKQEMLINAPKTGWAEQDPETWWENLKLATGDVLQKAEIDPDLIGAIGISYQMHGLVIVDKDYNVLRPSIIWCDSRAVEIGEKAFKELGNQRCLSSLLNSPGNFTASKLKWVQENEPEIYEKIHKIMLPGDYIAFRLTGMAMTTISGLSEGIFWNFEESKLADFLLDHYGISQDLIPEIVPTFSEQGRLGPGVAAELGLKSGIPVTYRAGDQPNNAFSLNVLNPGEIAATAGTSGVVYGVSDEITYDPESRVNTFAHVNHEKGRPRLGVLLCINGTGILYSWLKKNLGTAGTDYDQLNKMAGDIPAGAKGLTILPFGNGAERMLNNKDLGCTIANLNFNIHSDAHIIRAAQEGVVFAFHYGMEIMKNTGIQPAVIRAGHANMFLSPVFRESLSGLTGAVIELYDTDGAQGAAIGAGVGSGHYPGFKSAFSNLKKIKVIEPDTSGQESYQEAYQTWQSELLRRLA